MARILVVDDTEAIRLGLSLLLKRSGHDPVCAPGGAEALAVLEQQARPDLILLDLSMPEVDGISVLEELREWPEMAGVPVVVYSAVTDETIRRQAIKLGAAEFIEKGDLTWKELARRLEQHLTPPPPAASSIGPGPARHYAP